MLLSSALFFLLLQTNLFSSSAQFDYYCSKANGTYEANSTYSNNLDSALSSLPTNIGNDGFYSTSVGPRGPDRVHVIALCRGDAQLDQCRGCIRNLTVDLRRKCPSQMQAFEWADYCSLRYSNEDTRIIFGHVDQTKRSLLDWDKRYKIIGGIARGILYLHEDSQLRIIHRDLKPSNVLLDGAMNPKIADFGMARLFGQDETQGSTTKIAGTFGYMAPEYVMHGQFSIKSDVYSFGVLILEIISGQKNNGLRRGENAEDLLSVAWKNLHEGTVARMVDPCLISTPDSISHMQRCIHIGLLCVQEKASDRPTMASIVLMLNSSSLTLAAPTKPAFYMPSDYFSDRSLLQEHIAIEYESSSLISIPDQPENISRNDASFTDLCPR